MAARLDPEYLAFYNANLADKSGLHEIPWSPALRLQPPQPGGSEPIKVGEVRDIKLDTCTLRVFVPEGNPPETGWPGLYVERSAREREWLCYSHLNEIDCGSTVVRYRLSVASKFTVIICLI